MPLLSTSGADCVQGYGFGVGSSTTQVVYYFPSGTSTWTAPANVNIIVSAVGKGQDGAVSTWQTDNVGYSGVNVFASPPQTVALNWSTVYAEAQSALAAINVGAPAIRNYTGGPSYSFRALDPTTLLTGSVSNFTWPSYLPLRGTAVLVPTGSAATSGAVTSYGFWLVQCEALEGGYNGQATTGFARSFPGGTSTNPTAPTTTVTDIPVTPGATYTIVNNQSLIITYYI